MKRGKKIWLFGLLILIAAILLASMSIFNYRQSIIIHEAIYDVAFQFNKLQNWKNWHKEFGGKNDILFVTNNQIQEASLAGKKYTIHILNPTAIEINQTVNRETAHAFLTAIPYKDGSFTYVEWNEKITGITWLKRKLFNQDIIEESLDNLKTFFLDDNRKYGFTIKIIPVKDTLILTKIMMIRPQEIKSGIPLLYSELRNYIISNHIFQTADFYFVSFTAANKEKTELAVGIPVHTELPPLDGFKFLRLPSTGRLLEGAYKGTYAGRQELYNAMDKYIMDKKLKKVAQPLEKYNNSLTEINDTTQVTMTLLYPVFSYCCKKSILSLFRATTKDNHQTFLFFISRTSPRINQPLLTGDNHLYSLLSLFSSTSPQFASYLPS